MNEKFPPPVRSEAADNIGNPVDLMREHAEEMVQNIETVEAAYKAESIENKVHDKLLFSFKGQFGQVKSGLDSLDQFLTDPNQYEKIGVAEGDTVEVEPSKELVAAYDRLSKLYAKVLAQAEADGFDLGGNSTEDGGEKGVMSEVKGYNENTMSERPPKPVSEESKTDGEEVLEQKVTIETDAPVMVTETEQKPVVDSKDQVLEKPERADVDSRVNSEDTETLKDHPKYPELQKLERKIAFLNDPKNADSEAVKRHLLNNAEQRRDVLVASMKAESAQAGADKVIESGVTPEREPKIDNLHDIQTGLNTLMDVFDEKTLEDAPAYNALLKEMNRVRHLSRENNTDDPAVVAERIAIKTENSQALLQQLKDELAERPASEEVPKTESSDEDPDNKTDSKGTELEKDAYDTYYETRDLPNTEKTITEESEPEPLDESVKQQGVEAVAKAFGVSTEEIDRTEKYEAAKKAWYEARTESDRIENEFNEKYKEHIIKQNTGLSWDRVKATARRWFGLKPTLSPELEELQQQSVAARERYHKAAGALTEAKVVKDPVSYADAAKVQKVMERYQSLLAHKLVVDAAQRRKESQEKAIETVWHGSAGEAVAEALKKSTKLRIVAMIGGYALIGASGGVVGALAAGGGAALRIAQAIGFGTAAGTGVRAGGEAITKLDRNKLNALERKLKATDKDGEGFLKGSFLEAEQSYSQLMEKIDSKERITKTAAGAAAFAAGGLAAGIGGGGGESVEAATTSSDPTGNTPGVQQASVFGGGDPVRSTPDVQSVTAQPDPSRYGDFPTQSADTPRDIRIITPTWGIPAEANGASIPVESVPPSTGSEPTVTANNTEAPQSDGDSQPQATAETTPTERPPQPISETNLDQTSVPVPEDRPATDVPEAPGSPTELPVPQNYTDVQDYMDGLPWAMPETSYDVESGDNFWDMMEGQTNSPQPEIFQHVDPENHQQLIALSLEFMREHPEFAEQAGFPDPTNLDLLHPGDELSIDTLNYVLSHIAENEGLINH